MFTTDTLFLGVVLKWSEPLDGAKPSKQWRLYVFKNDEISETLHLHRQSAYLFGRDKRVADIELKHESCSKQHAVIQYRFVVYLFVFIFVHLAVCLISVFIL